MGNIGFHIKEGFRGFAVSKGGSISGVVISVLAMLMMGVFLTISYNIYKIVEESRSQVQMEVFLRDSADYKVIEESILKIDGILNTVYISKKQAEEEFRRAFKEDSLLLDLLDKNYFPQSLRLKLETEYNNTFSMEEIAGKIREIEGVENVEYAKVWLERLEKVARILMMTGIITGLILSIIAMVVTAGAIKLTIYSRRKRIEIMRLVGATNNFIRAPFIFEGGFIGMFGGLFAWLLIYSILWFIRNYTLIEPLNPPFEYMAGLISYSFIIGIVSALISVNSFLRSDSIV
ncbi:MAG: cell division protein FtsX [bacterium]